MNSLLWVALLSILPIFELRGAIPFGIQQNLNPFAVFFIAVFFNIAIIPVIFLFLDYLHEHFMKIYFYRRCFDIYVKRLTRNVNEKLKKMYEYLVLFSFVAIPLPGTGAYTGVLIAWLFGLDRKKSFYTIASAVVVAGIITLLASLGIFSIF